jgi:c-di-GMP-binding flagellar brake protein YcgR
MLSPGVKMRCILKLPKRELQFVTTVLALSEDHLYVRPPIAKGKPASLGNLRQLDFRVSRENDAEYEFTCRMLGQTPNEMKAVQLEHSHNINRLLFRNAERVDVEIDTQFYVIRQEFLGDKVGPRKAQDSQYMFRGTIKDLSIGGALVLAETPLRQLNDGDMIVFKLPEAQIKEDLAGLVVGGFPRGEQHAQVHLQFLGLKELNRLKLSKYLETLRTPPPTPDQAPGPSAPAPT